MNPHNPIVHCHSPSSPLLRTALQSSLPYSINLAYRTQHPNRTSSAHILATFPPSASSVPECWAATYLDRSMRPETEMWVFAAGEDPGHRPSSSSILEGDRDEEGKEGESGFCKTCKAAVLALLDYISHLPTPPLHPENAAALEMAKQHEIEFPTPGPDGRYASSAGTFMRHLLLPKVATLGCCHHAAVQICQEAGVVRREFPGIHAELNKFLFKLSDLPETRELPQGLQWGEVREEDVAVVKARTVIPRSTRTLLSLKSVAVFEEDTNTIVAWTFLGLDGSLTTLHTEEKYRGKGIAKAVAARIFRKYAPGLAVDEHGNTWSHADVYAGNVESEGVCQSLGGKSTWRCFWIRIDLDKAGTLVEEYMATNKERLSNHV